MTATAPPLGPALVGLALLAVEAVLCGLLRAFLDEFVRAPEKFLIPTGGWLKRRLNPCLAALRRSGAAGGSRALYPASKAYGEHLEIPGDFYFQYVLACLEYGGWDEQEIYEEARKRMWTDGYEERYVPGTSRTRWTHSADPTGPLAKALAKALAGEEIGRRGGSSR